VRQGEEVETLTGSSWKDRQSKTEARVGEIPRNDLLTKSQAHGNSNNDFRDSDLK
jgi:hypothetical protein